MAVHFSKIRFLFRAYKYKLIADKAELEYISKSVNPCELVLDIGSHKGAYLYWLQKAVGSNGKVMAIEPQPSLYNYVKEAINIFGFNQVDLVHGGLSSQEGKLELFIPNAEGLTSPGATFEKREGRTGHTIEVPIFQLDKLLEKRTQPVALIKMDVEGHEIEVFKGAQEILKTDKPKLIFECENRHLNDQTVTDIFSYVKNLGYKGSFFKDGTLLPIDLFDAQVDQRVDENLKILDKKAYCNNFVFEYGE